MLHSEFQMFSHLAVQALTTRRDERRDDCPANMYIRANSNQVVLVCLLHRFSAFLCLQQHPACYKRRKKIPQMIIVIIISGLSFSGVGLLSVRILFHIFF